MGKLPAYLHYAKDWLTDTNLMLCSKAAKGVWQDILDVMFLNSVRGVACTEDGIPWADEDLARAIGGDISENLTRISELLAKGVARRNANGAIYSRRMVADEKERHDTKLRVQKYRSGNVTSDVTVEKRSSTGSANETGKESAFEVVSKEPETKDIVVLGEVVEKESPPIAGEVFLPEHDKAPDGFDAASLAVGLLGRLDIPVSRGYLSDAATAIELVMKKFGLSVAGAHDWHLLHARAARQRGEKVDRFYFQDGMQRWIGNGKQLSKSEQRRQNSIDEHARTQELLRRKFAKSAGNH